jgi:hypothetical protein
MAERKAYHQLDPIRLNRKAFDALPLRQEVKGEAYKDGQQYRDATYPNEVFVWTAYPKGAETKGEWLMAAVDIGG